MDVEMDNKHKKDAFILAIRKGYNHSRKAHDLIIKEDVEISIALAYLNSAISSMNSAMVLHACMNDKLGDFEEIHHKFNVFSKEFLNSCATEHSHQWTDIEFLEFEKEYKHSIVPDYAL